MPFEFQLRDVSATKNIHTWPNSEHYKRRLDWFFVAFILGWRNTFGMVVTLRRFPVQVMLTALLIYGLTLSHGVTLASLPLAAKVAGWDWQPMGSQPLLWLLTLPLRELPTGWVALGLNFFSALCGALTLGILTRSLELAAWDRPLAMLGRLAKLPLLLAGVLCGLELHFWQEATAATGESLQILLFAAAIWCLLEYRVARQFEWMQAAVFIWSLGVVENWMMLFTLPLFIISVFWLGKLSLLNMSSFRRLTLAGLAGFSIFILLPLVNGLAPDSPLSFSGAWIHALKNFKNLFVNLYEQFCQNRLISVVGMAFYLVPILPVVLRMRDEGTQNHYGIYQFQVWLFRGFRTVLLLACVWLAWDPVAGPRQIIFKEMNLSLPLLSLDYLVALGSGFLAGNLLLGLLAPVTERYRKPRFAEKILKPAVAPMIILLVVVLTAGLIFRNAPAIKLANRQPLTQFGELALRSLPPSGGIILSDDPERLLIFQATAAELGVSAKWLALDTRALSTPVYWRWLGHSHAHNPVTEFGQNYINSGGTMNLIAGLAQTNRLYYLHQSFGFFFDSFYLQPVGSVFELQAFTGKAINPPPLTDESIATTEKIWNEFAPAFTGLQRVCSPKKADFNSLLEKHLHLQPLPILQSQVLAEWYSQALDNWGVQLQRANRLAAAHQRFEQALTLNPDNSAAQLNLQSNTNLANGIKLNLTGVDPLATQFGSFQHLNLFIMAFGSVDEPSFCYLFGNLFQKTGMPRQALQQFERARTLAPDVIAPKIMLAELYTRYGYETQAKETISQMRNQLPSLPGKNNLDVGLALLEANSWLLHTNTTKASSILDTVLKTHPDEARTADLVLHTYLAFGDYTNALLLINHQLAMHPEDASRRLDQAALYQRLGNLPQALASLDKAVAQTNSPQVRLARAIARVEAGQYAEAEADYLEVEKHSTNYLPIFYGLAEIADRRHDTNRAIEYLKRCLTNLPPDFPQHDLIAGRLKTLMPVEGKP